MNAKNVVVGREHVHDLRVGGVRLERHRDLSIVNAREVARTSRLVFFRLERERVGVHTRVRGTGVVVERLHLVEVLTLLFLEAVLTVEDQLEGVERTRGEGERSAFFGPLHAGTGRTNGKERGTGTFGDRHVAVTVRRRVGFEDDGTSGRGVGGEVPVLGVGGATVVETPHKFLNWVVVGQAHLLGGTGGDRVRTSVLHLLDEVFVTLLREAAALFGVEVHVVAPHLEGRTIGVLGEFRRQIEVDADFVVLKGNQRQVQTRVAVEEEQEREENRAGRGGNRVGRHLTVVRLLGVVQVQLRVQTPPLLVVLVDALTTDAEFNILDRTFGDPARIEVGGTGLGAEGRGDEFDVHVADQITVTGNGHGHTAVVGRGTVDSLFDVFHREVRVSLVHSLEEGNLRVTREIHVLGAVRHELHETTGHCEIFVLYTEIFFLTKIAGCEILVSIFSQSIQMSDRPEEEVEEFVSDDDIINDEEVFDDEEEEEDDDDDEIQGDLGFLMTGLLATPDGDTVCSALVNIATQLEMQNKILIKMLTKLSKKDN